MKKFILLILLILLTACSKTNPNKTEEEIIPEDNYAYNTEISLGYELPSITLDCDYKDLEINDEYFDSKKPDKAYEPKDNLYPILIVYRYSKDYENTLELANYELVKYGSNDELTKAENFVDENYEFSYVPSIVNFKQHDYLSEKFYYEGPNDFVCLEKLYYLNEIEINDSGIYIKYPDLQSKYLDDCYLTLIDEGFVLPTIYIYCLENNTNIDDYISDSLNYDSIESNYMHSITLQEKEYPVNILDFTYNNDFKCKAYFYTLEDQSIIIEYCYEQNNKIVEMSMPLLKPYTK